MFIVVIGTKAQLVKMAPVILEMRSRKIPFKFVLTGQHKETMSDLIENFGLPGADVVLVDYGESDSPMSLAKWFVVSFVRMQGYMRGLPKISGILVHGDTFSTLWGGMLGRLKGIRVYHVEAGLRSFNLLRPFPEEIVRIVVTWCAAVLFAPGDWASSNLSKYPRKKVINTRLNTLVDSLRFALQVPKPDEVQKAYLVASVHRAENVLNKKVLAEIVDIVVSMSAFGCVKFVLHPVTKKYLEKYNLLAAMVGSDVELVDRMNYVKFIQLLMESRGLVTDGGSNQEESFYMGLPCLLMRKETERQEGLGSNVRISMLDKAESLKFAADCFSRRWQPAIMPSHSPSAEIAEVLRGEI